MEMMKHTLFLLYLLATCCVQSHSLPAASQDSKALSFEHDNARKMWSRAKLAYKNIMKEEFNTKKLKRREATGSSTSPNVDPDDNIALANMTGPKYVKDLFKNISNYNPTQANIIRSLKYSPNGKIWSLSLVMKILHGCCRKDTHS